MALWEAFCGGMYQALSPSIAADTCINLFLETRKVPGSPKQTTLYGTPGRVLDATVIATGCRGWFTQDGQTWVVVGDTLYERTAAATYTSRGTIANDGAPVSYATNGQGGNQLGIVGGGHLYVLNLTTNALTTVSLPFSNPVMIRFLDGYGLINEANTPKVWFSAIEDLTAWDSLDFFTRSSTSDNIVGIAVTRDRVWTLGSVTTTQFYDSGNSDIPFLPYPGTTTQTGLAAASLLGVFQDVLYYVEQNPVGDRRVVAVADAAPQRISTPPIERWLQTQADVTNGEILIYEQEGHLFICITLPDSTDPIKTYCYDMRENVWHARAGWDGVSGTYTRWTAKGSTTTTGSVFVGDSQSGHLYTLDLDAYTDNGDLIHRERTAPYVSSDNQVFFVDQFQLGTQAGVGLSSGQGSNPLVTLEISRDGGNLWINAGTAPLGAIGAYKTRTIWRKLGRFIAGLCLFRVTQSDPVKTVWGPGAYLRVTPGTGQL